MVCTFFRPSMRLIISPLNEWKRSAISNKRQSGVRTVCSPPRKAAKSTTLASTPRMFARPRYQALVSGTLENSGSGSISAASSSLSSQLPPPACTPNREVGSASVWASRNLWASPCWNSRKLICFATASRLFDRRDLREQILRVDRFHQVILRALAHPPDAIGFLVLARDDDDGDVLGRLVARDGTRRLEAIGTRHDHVHQDEIGPLRLRLGDCLITVLRRLDLVPLLGQRFHEKLPVGRRVIHDQDLLYGHGHLLRYERARAPLWFSKDYPS